MASLLEKELELVLRAGDYISYRETASFVESLVPLELKFKKLLKSDPDQAVDLYQKLIGACYDKSDGLDDSFGEFGEFVGELFCGWIQARQAARALPEETVEILLEWFDDDPYGYCFEMQSEFVEALDQDGRKALERALRGSLDKCSSDYRRHTSKQFLKEIYIRRKSQEAYEAYRDLCEPSPGEKDCLALAHMCRPKTPELALEWVQRGLDRTGTMDYRLADLRRELLCQLDRREEAIEFAWAEFRGSPSLAAFQILTGLVDPSERADWRGRALGVLEKAPLDRFVKVCLGLEETDRLRNRLEKTSLGELKDLSHYSTEPVAEILRNVDPTLAGRVYEALGLRIVEGGRHRYYGEAVSHFADARECYTRAGCYEEWERLLQSVRSEHSRKYGVQNRLERMLKESAPTLPERAARRWTKVPGQDEMFHRPFTSWVPDSKDGSKEVRYINGR